MSYDPALRTNVDWVRFFTGDRDEDNEILVDEEITALLTEEQNKYLASARAGEVIISRGRGAVSKAVDGLSISYGDSPESSYRKHLQRLREKGCRKLLLQPHVFKIL